MLLLLITYSHCKIDGLYNLTLSLPDTRICVNFSTVYNDTLVAKGLNRVPTNLLQQNSLIFQTNFHKIPGASLISQKMAFHLVYNCENMYF